MKTKVLETAIEEVFSHCLSLWHVPDRICENLSFVIKQHNNFLPKFSKYDEQAIVDFESLHRQPALKSPSPWEKQMSTIYAHAIFKKFQVDALGVGGCQSRIAAGDEIVAKGGPKMPNQGIKVLLSEEDNNVVFLALVDALRDCIVLKISLLQGLVKLKIPSDDAEAQLLNAEKITAKKITENSNPDENIWWGSAEHESKSGSELDSATKFLPRRMSSLGLDVTGKKRVEPLLPGLDKFSYACEKMYLRFELGNKTKNSDWLL
ncbi:unnamed protein product [Sphenostylis stenocarpa]|uniref:Uncharacterized protein n=1 Tax=Sphenostylis stenocarpa TaxID=92480 RepID=A0AA86W309_9FABA|nr:unnamed protein product [Sphenostylis stenocarpa]